MEIFAKKYHVGNDVKEAVYDIASLFIASEWNGKLDSETRRDLVTKIAEDDNHNDYGLDISMNKIIQGLIMYVEDYSGLPSQNFRFNANELQQHNKDYLEEHSYAVKDDGCWYLSLDYAGDNLNITIFNNSDNPSEDGDKIAFHKLFQNVFKTFDRLKKE